VDVGVLETRGTRTRAQGARLWLQDEGAGVGVWGSTGVALLVDFACYVTTHASVERSVHDFRIYKEGGDYLYFGTCPHMSQRVDTVKYIVLNIK
jgi:hypothetical protein